MMKFAFLLLSLSVFGQIKSFKITTSHLVDNVYVHVSYGLPDGKNVYPSNGLYIVTNAGIVLIDTPWGEDQTKQLLDLLQKQYHKKILYCISTHFHADRTCGVDVLKKHGIKTYSTALTKQLAKEKGDKQPEFTFQGDTIFREGNLTVQTYYPGAGHTVDNIVVWLPQSKVLFGGCFVKSFDAKDLGNLEDANVKQWPLSIGRAEKCFPEAKYVIPGHEGWQGGTKVLTHTLMLLSKKVK